MVLMGRNNQRHPVALITAHPDSYRLDAAANIPAEAKGYVI
jgi:hypothetical protein